MARRCGCAGSVCSCFVSGTGNATVTGNGSEADPFVVDVDPAVIQVADTATLDMHITGAGTPASPYVISGDVLGGSGGISTEAMMDFLGGVTTPTAGLIGSGMITVTYSDTAVGGAGTITFSTVHSESYLLTRANHTGSRPNWATDYDNVSDAAPSEGHTIRYRSGIWTPEALDTTNFALKSGSVTQFSDWDDVSPGSSGIVVPVWDPGTNKYFPEDISGLFAGLDGTGRIAAQFRPKYNPDIIVINEGDPVPGDAGAGGVGALVWEEAAAPSLIPTSHGTNGGANVAAATGVTKQTTSDINPGDVITLFVGASGEVTLPTTYTVTLSAGAVSGGFATIPPNSQITGSAQSDIIMGICTTLIPSGTSITVKGNQSRVELMLGIASTANLKASPLDKDAEGSGNNSSTLTLTGASTGTLAQADEVAVFMLTANSGNPTIRAYDAFAGDGWIPLFAQIDVLAASSGRSMRAWYKVVSATAAITPKVTVTNPTSGDTGAWAMKSATLMAA